MAKYSNQEKKLIIQEFLEKYKKNPNLSANKFNTEKFGSPQSTFFKWLKLYDTNNIYKFRNSHDRRRKEQKASTFVSINKTAVSLEQSVRVSTDFIKISILVNFFKNKFVKILLAIKESKLHVF